MPQTTPFYRRLAADAWHIAWHHKHLWVFGLFATVVGFGGVTEPLSSSTDRVYSLMPGLMNGRQPVEAVPGLRQIAASLAASDFPALSFTFGAIAFIACAVVAAFLVYGAIGALVHAIRRIERGGDASFADDVKVGAEKFWRVLGVNVACSLVTFVAYLLTASSLERLMVDGGVVSTVFYFAAFVLFTCLAVGAAVTAIFATCEVIGRNRPVNAAIGAAVDLTMRHWLHALEMAVLVLVASLAIGIIALVIAALVGAPFAFLLYVAYSAGWPTLYVLAATTSVALIVALIAMTGSLVTTFQVAAWTLLWSDIAQGRHAPPKTVRLAKKHAPKWA